MAEITTVNCSKRRVKLAVNPMEYHAIKDSEHSFRKELAYRDDTDPIFIDSARLMNCWGGIRSKDYKYYYYLLNKLVRNDEAIRLKHQEVREFFRDKSVQIVAQAINRLVREGLIFRLPNTRGFYIINPSYAWRGNRLDYLDKNIFLQPG